MSRMSFEIVTGRLGVGAIAFLGLFLIVDGMQIGVFKMIETYGKSTTWGIIGVIPTTVVIYIVGLFCLEVADIFLSRFTSFSVSQPDEIIAVSSTGSDMLQQLYAEHLRNHELLKGTSVSFLILAVGSIAETSNMPSYGAIVWCSTAGAFALAILSLLFSQRAGNRAKALSAAVQNQGTFTAQPVNSADPKDRAAD